MPNYLTYPTKIMRITQSYTGNISHSINSSGYPCDYPIDEACENYDREYIYCPCDEMEIVRIYGVENSGTNTIWLESTSKVDMPCGNNYITMLVMHPNDDDLKNLKVGKVFKRNEPMFREGNDGQASGYHFHISFGLGKILGNGWVKNNKNGWVILSTGQAIKPEEACYLDTEFTKVIDSKNINFIKLPTQNNTNEVTYMKGIDVSKHNGIIDWNKVKSDGINFVMVRAGFGSARSQIDPKFTSNVEGAIKAGINVGCYWFSYARNITEVKEEAKLFNEVLTPYRGKLTFPICFDFEYDSVNYAKKNGITITKDMSTEFALIFCQEMEKYGWYSMNYTNYDYYINYFDSNKLKNIDIWYANWSVKEPNIECGIWQYSASGKVNGLSGNVDINISYKDYPTIIKNSGLNGFSDIKHDDNEPEKDYKTLYEEQLKVNKTLQEANDNLRGTLTSFKSELQSLINNY